VLPPEAERSPADVPTPQDAQSALPLDEANDPASEVGTNFIVRAVRRVEPSVVRIEATFITPGDDLSPFPPGFFDEGGTPVPQGAGTGFVIDEDGHILTNAHVVGQAQKVQVVLRDGRSLDGWVLGSDPVTDVAVVKIDAPDLPAVPLGNSDNVQPGEWAIAIGNPLGLDSTVTVGIISATGRSSRDVGVPDKRVGFIQTDAAINPGNSGGPLLNASGAAIGMNTAIIDGAQGLGFAIPIETALRVARQLIEDGSAEHPYLGIQMVTIDDRLDFNTPEFRDFPKVEASSGVLIVRVMPDSPAEAAGLKQGDVLQQIDDLPVQDAETVQQIVQETAIGEAIALKVQRQTEVLTIQVRPGELPLP
jgi:S1-C subfamily serine protease